MPKFNVPYILEYSGSILIEADTKEAAMKIVEEMGDQKFIEESSDHNLEILEDEVDEES